ncbi:MULTISPECIES: dihydrofolate reductase [Paenibacillus]|uniref:Dihydrofolate reductase n=1 Tax=Paenibacillus macerans TaxID=44252 RepID=A0A090ZBW7_PAEMA|nr:dihydrofolate reductase [Paenibacillus macerans]KFN08789.1 dihydrofolate reductase family protein [Paenibacillus macerans]MCY7562135.1 dihydrofolate reductase [Paenibacillus macerans]MEC0153765.1 dihydrofolate reductase [Paenibacillus macerans]SUA83412.1 dihydrofolate reductase [Paenibacillus macerans]
MSITLIWAMAQNGVIGRNNQLPWRLPADLKFFKAQTMGKTMIMGRKTWESMGSKPLPGRHSVVLTQDTSYRAEGADIVHTLEEALRYEKEGEELMVIGGAGVFRFFLPVADKLLVTRIDEDIEGDVFFPSLNWEDFDLVHEEQGIRDDKNPYDYRFLTYERRK